MKRRSKRLLNVGPGDKVDSYSCTDVPWKKLATPEAAGATKRRGSRASDALKILADLVRDPLTCENTLRILDQLKYFLDLNANDGFYVKDLNDASHVLEFLARTDHRELQIYREKLLRLCWAPPLLTIASESLFCRDILEHYFTMLAYLMVVLPTTRDVTSIHVAVRRLLFRTKPVHVDSVKLELCHRAVETSILPVTIVNILEIASVDTFSAMLEITLVLVSVSDVSCYKMLEAGVLEHVMLRLNPNYMTTVHDGVPVSEMLEQELGDERDLELLILATNVIWALFRCVAASEPKQRKSNEFPSPSRGAMWSLRYAFRREVRLARRSQYRTKMRNDLAALVLAALTTFPSWQFVECGLAEDLIILATATELGTNDTWASNVNLDNSNDDLSLKKVLMTLVCHLVKIKATVKIMVERRVLSGFLSLLNPRIDEKTYDFWSETQFWDLHQYVLDALPILVPLMLDQFVKYRGSSRLLMVLEWSSGVLGDQDIRLLVKYAKTTCSILLNADSIVLKDFRDQGGIGVTMKLVDRILSLEVLTLRHELILTRLIVILETLMKNEQHYLKLYGEQNVRIALKLLQRGFDNGKGNFRLDRRLLIAVGAFSWECIVWCSSSLRMFVERGGIFAILDVMDVAMFPVHIIFLGLLCDICNGVECAAHLCTWRGMDKELGLLSLLAKVWREEEIRINVKRTPEGCIEDVELPIMGAEQWVETYHSNDHTYSPTLADMTGSCRPKIYGIRAIIERNSSGYELARNHYKILLDDMPTRDQITLQIVDHYFGLMRGQVWTEVQNDLEVAGIKPLNEDEKMISVAMQQHLKASLELRMKQDAILKLARDAEIKRDTEILDEIAKSQRLDALQASNCESGTRNREFTRRSKKRERNRVDAVFCFPERSDPEHCHRSACDRANVTDRRHCFNGVQVRMGTDIGRYKLMPEFPVSSGVTIIVSPEISTELDEDHP